MFGAQPIRKVPQDRSGGRARPDDPLTAFKAEIALPPQVLSLANFEGNQTVITAGSGNGLVLARQANCSLTAFNVPYSYNLSDPYSTAESKTATYDQLLHSEAGLTTTAGNFGATCPDQAIGVVSDSFVYAGQSTGGMRMSAGVTYDSHTGTNVLYTFVMQQNGAFVSSTLQALPSANGPAGLVSADLNGDGNPDLIAVQNSGISTVTASITILLGKADGTFSVGQTYSLGTGYSDSAVIDDFNGDGKLDVVVAVGGANPIPGTPGVLTFLPGNGDGTFGTPKTLSLTSKAESLVSGDFNGDGKKDLVSGTGSVFLGNGDGTFQLLSTPVFSGLETNSSNVPQLAAADFNKDGKLDLAAGTGDQIFIFLGKGNGTFVSENAYAGIGNLGYLAASDIDGDGNIDLFSGSGRSGVFSGDLFSPNEGYALMGRGDGSFTGAPEVTYASFNTLQDLNGDRKLDFIGLMANSTEFGSFLGNGNGTFRAEGTPLQATTFSYQGQTYTTPGAESYTTGDLNGDGITDIFHLPSVTPGTNTPFGFVTALGNADGSFQTPVFTPAPPLIAGGNNQYLIALSGVQGAINQAGKFEVVYGYSTSYIDASSNTVVYNLGYATQVSNGDGTFAAPALTITYNGTNPGSQDPFPPPASLSLADLNGDKIPDMIVYTPPVSNGLVVTAPAVLQVMLGKSDGTFSAGVTVPVVPNPTGNSIAVGDVNGDGIPDIIAEGITTFASGNINNNTYGIGVALGKGNGTFNVKPPFRLENSFGFELLAIGDFTADGKADLAVTGSENGIFPGNGDGTFQSTPSGNNDGLVVPVQAIEVVSGSSGLSGAFDLNGDGKLSLVAGDTFYVPPSDSIATALNASSTALAASATAIAAGQSVTLTATVSAATGTGTPTGSVAFANGATSLGNAALSASGVATLATTSLPAGTDTITAQYSGDADFDGSISSSTTVTVGGTTVNGFTVSLSSVSATVSSGGSTTTTVSVQPAGGFSQAVSFACSGLPAGATCSFAPATVTPSGSAASTTVLTIATGASASLAEPSRARGDQGYGRRPIVAWGIVLLGARGFMSRRRRKAWRRWMAAAQSVGMLVGILAVLAGLSSCGGSSSNSGNGGGGGSNPATSTVTVTASAGSISQTATFSLTVQ